MLNFKEVITILLSYMLGCISTGYYLVHFSAGKDIRSHGSQSTGARNVGRTLGAPAFVITFLGDFAKGAIATGMAIYLGLAPLSVILVVIAVVAGHIWPAQLGFRGGKGLSTTLGALLVFDYRLAIVLLLLAGLALAIIRQFSPGGLTAIVLSPGVVAIMEYHLTIVLSMAVLATIILIAHQTNIREIFTATRSHIKRVTD